MIKVSCIYLAVNGLWLGHLHHHLFADTYFQVTREGVVHAYGTVTDGTFVVQHPEGRNRGVAAQVHLTSGCEITHRELGGAILMDEGRLAVAQFGSHLLHQAIAWEGRIPSQEYNSGGIAPERHLSESVNDEVFHIVWLLLKGFGYKFEVVDETKLFATVKIDGKDVTDQIAEINNEATTLSTNGLNAPNSISLIKNDVSKLLVNTNDLYTFIGAKGYICGETEKSVTIKFQNQDHFQAKFVRPVNIDPVAADYFVDALDFGEPHTFIRLEDLINPYDWRNRHFVAPYENYWEYYGIEKIEVVDDNILWDAEGSKSAKPENIVVKADYDTKEMGSGTNKKTSKFGFLTYRNGNAYAKSFNFYVKVRVTYAWGVIETTEVVVNVRETIGDVD